MKMFAKRFIKYVDKVNIRQIIFHWQIGDKEPNQLWTLGEF